MASHGYFNNLVSINDIFYASHSDLLDRICMRLGAEDRADELREELLQRAQSRAKDTWILQNDAVKLGVGAMKDTLKGDFDVNTCDVTIIRTEGKKAQCLSADQIKKMLK